MRVTYVKTNERIPTDIDLLSGKELKAITRNPEFEFKWKLEREYEIYKLFRTDTGQILGLMSVANSPESVAIHIRLLESGKTNVGTSKELEGIAGCLIAWACRLSFLRGYDGWIKLTAKSELIKHYVSHYGMIQIGQTQTCKIEQDQAYVLIRKYLHD